MPTLVFDIETVGEPWSDLDEVTKIALTRWIDRTLRTDAEREAAKADVEAGLGFSPLTGKVVAIGLYDIERCRGVVYYSGERDMADYMQGEYTFKQRGEVEMLQEFWDGVRHYDTFVTFNGRNFDAPFLVHRSLIAGVQPTKNLLEGRYQSQQKTCHHIDLQDEMTFFGAMYRRPSLHLFCRAYGISSPKEKVGGDDVAELFANKKFRDIAEYNARDVIATTALFKKWKIYRDSIDSNQIVDF